MATSDIAKQSVFDKRIIQHSPAFAVSKGALSLTATPFAAISQTTTQHTYNCPIPSQNVFIDRAVDWNSTVIIKAQLGPIATPRGANEAILAFGRNCAFTNFPLHSMVQTMTATINDTTVTMNTSDVLKEVLRLTSMDENKISRTCPTKDDTYWSYNDGFNSINTPLAGYDSAYDAYQVGNGTYPQVYFCDSTGAVLSGTASYNDENGLTVNYVNGVPVRTAASDAGSPCLYIQLTSTEKLVLSPFVFANAHEWDTGLFGINAIQFVMNLGSPSRVLRVSSADGRTLVGGGASFPTSLSGGRSVFQNSQILTQILTPSLDVPLPPKSVVPYMEFPRYITNYAAPQAVPGTQTGAVGGLLTIPSQTIVLPQIPDMLIIYARPQTYPDATYGDFHYPPVNISLNFDNFAGLLSAHRQTQLYQMAVHNGLRMDYAQWVGQGYTAQSGKDIPTVGGFLILRPGVDFALQSGQAPGLAGNFVLQYNLQIQNTTGADIAQNTAISLYTIAVNAGFFESMAGSSRVVKSVVSEADIIGAEPAAVGSGDDLKRLVGAGLFDNLGSMFSKALNIYRTTKPVVSAVKDLLPDSGALGKVKGVASKLGYGGVSGGVKGLSGGDGVGATGGRKKMSLSARLM